MVYTHSITHTISMCYVCFLPLPHPKNSLSPPLYMKKRGQRPLLSFFRIGKRSEQGLIHLCGIVFAVDELPLCFELIVLQESFLTYRCVKLQADYSWVLLIGNWYKFYHCKTLFIVELAELVVCINHEHGVVVLEPAIPLPLHLGLFVILECSRQCGNFENLLICEHDWCEFCCHFVLFLCYSWGISPTARNLGGVVIGSSLPPPIHDRFLVS